MPELPEAETIAKGLASILPGRRVHDVEVLRPDVVHGPPRRFAGRLKGREMGAVGRRGKNVILGMAGGSRVVVNLGMTGRLLPGPTHRAAPLSRHAAVLIRFEDGSSLTYDDVRRFGRLTFLDPLAWTAWSRSLGPEPLSARFSGKRLAQTLSASRSPIRSLLLDQRKVAGVGNIYALEALWKARVHPARPANTLTRQEVQTLHRVLRKVLRDAVEARGTTLRDYRTAEGQVGGFGPRLLVYGREGEDCHRCRSRLVRIRLSGRSAFFCPECQRA